MGNFVKVDYTHRRDTPDNPIEASFTLADGLVIEWHSNLHWFVNIDILMVWRPEYEKVPAQIQTLQ